MNRVHGWFSDNKTWIEFISKRPLDLTFSGRH
jgi:hypothetical protein